jgi:hypothetical protein
MRGPSVLPPRTVRLAILVLNRTHEVFLEEKKTKQLPFYAIRSHIPLIYIIVVALCHNVHALNLFQFWVCLLLLPECANF